LIPEKTDGSFEAYRFPGGMPENGATGCLMKHPMRKPSLEGTLVDWHPAKLFFEMGFINRQPVFIVLRTSQFRIHQSLIPRHNLRVNVTE
jgi:hypothetical protein